MKSWNQTNGHQEAWDWNTWVITCWNIQRSDCSFYWTQVQGNQGKRLMKYPLSPQWIISCHKQTPVWSSTKSVSNSELMMDVMTNQRRRLTSLSCFLWSWILKTPEAAWFFIVAELQLSSLSDLMAALDVNISTSPFQKKHEHTGSEWHLITCSAAPFLMRFEVVMEEEW